MCVSTSIMVVSCNEEQFWGFLRSVEVCFLSKSEGRKTEREEEGDG